jgi:FkbM family methyltransferase
VAALSKSAAGRFALGQLRAATFARTQLVSHRGVQLRFFVPNPLNKARIDTFATKEPETLEWIDAIPRGSVLWDIGANVGLYTCYAAKARDCRVYAFEPSVFNVELLARNIFLNGLVDRATIIPLPLSDAIRVNGLRMTTTEWGGALSTFGEAYGHDGRPFEPVFEFRTLGISMDEMAALGIERPQYIKMDVDGIEHVILAGGTAVLAQARGVLIEVNDDFAQQAAGCAEALTRAGLTLRDKRHSDLIEGSVFQSAFNQIWVRG